MIILVLNCGSSSIKYQLLDTEKEFHVMAKGLIERIGLPMGMLTLKYHGQVYTEECPIVDHADGIRMVLKALTHPEIGVIHSYDEIDAVGNRMAHGGEYFRQSMLVDDAVLEKLRTVIELAPLHIPGNLAGIEAMRKVLPNVPQVVVFDTAFHATIPPKAYLYGLPYEYYEKYGIRRYGFHGTSHGYVAEKGARMLDREYRTGRSWTDMKIITCHLGSGASIAAIDHGRSMDTTMGMTSLEGLVMGSRLGDCDAGALTYLMERENLDRNGIEKILYKKSGLVGISGDKQDMRDIYAGKQAGDERCTNAFDVFAYRVKKYIGSYMAAMNGCDLVVFTGGIGENAWFMRHAILEDMDYLGLDVDMELNDKVMGEDHIISRPNSRVKVAVVTTNEELVIAQETLALL
ncbi:MAG: acetate kinase [Bacteroidales bacterium]|nr:acetate kinase [Bacteroidales bacterium]MCF0211949.1 acetate kinase [Bacteroidales bacterium]